MPHTGEARCHGVGGIAAIAVGEHHRCTGLGESLRGCSANATATARNHRNFARERCTHLSPNLQTANVSVPESGAHISPLQPSNCRTRAPSHYPVAFLP